MQMGADDRSAVCWAGVAALECKEELGSAYIKHGPLQHAWQRHSYAKRKRQPRLLQLPGANLYPKGQVVQLQVLRIRSKAVACLSLRSSVRKLRKGVNEPKLTSQ
jgi:hypothetical protein